MSKSDELWPGARLPRADDLTKVTSDKDTATRGLVLGVRGITEYKYA